MVHKKSHSDCVRVTLAPKQGHAHMVSWSYAARVSVLVCSLFSLNTHLAFAQTPIAKCNIQTISQQSQNILLNGIVSMVTQSPTNDQLGYRRGPAGDWLVPEEVDAKDDSIRGLLITPGGLLLVEFQVELNGQPFRSVVEQWIDSALETKENPKKPVGATNEELAELTTEETAGKVGGSMPTRFVPPAAPDWLSEYVSNSSAPVDRFEARWLIAQRNGGPTLMKLQRFSTKRSTAAPLVHFLDRDSNGVLSAQELQQASSQIEACDFNQDSVVDFAELDRLRPRQTSRYRPWRAEPLFIVIEKNTDWQQLTNAI